MNFVFGTANFMYYVQCIFSGSIYEILHLRETEKLGGTRRCIKLYFEVFEIIFGTLELNIGITMLKPRQNTCYD